MDILIIAIGIAILILLVILLLRTGSSSAPDMSEELRKLADSIRTENEAADRQLRSEITSNVQLSVKNLGDMLSSNQKASGDAVNAQLTVLENRFKTLESHNEEKLEAIKHAIRKINKKLPSFKQVREIELRNEEFPKTTSKKIKRHLIK